MLTYLDWISSGLCWGAFAYKWMIIIAILLTWVQADIYNPIVQKINKAVFPLWNWCEEWLPLPLKNFNAYISLLVILFLQVTVPASLLSLGVSIEGGMWSAAGIQIGGHLIQGVSIVVQSVTFFVMLLAMVWFILTLTNPAFNNPIVRVVHVLIDPFLTPIQRMLPRTNVDLSPILLAVFCFILSGALQSLQYYGASFSYPIRVCSF